MRAHIATLIALNTFIRIPDRQTCRNTALFIGRQAHVDRAVLISHQGADRQVVSLLGVDRIQELGHD